MRIRVLCIAFFLSTLLLTCAFSQQESLIITSYYPSPFGSYRELTAHRMKIGTNYSGSGTTVADNTLIVEGFVGIGLTDPGGYRLRVRGDVGLDTDPGVGGALRFIENGTQRQMIAYDPPGGYLYGYNWALTRDFMRSYNTGNVVLQPSGGNVGIGIAVPGAKLDVSDTAATVGVRYSKTGSRDARIQIGDPGRTWGLAVGWATQGDFSIIEEGVAGDRLYIRQGGNVGIGTSNPNASSRLDIAGEIHSSDTASGFFLGGGAWTDNWARLTTDAGGTYHDLAIDNLWAAGAVRYDLSEVTPVKKDDKLTQGDAVVIDQEDGLRVSKSSKPYDTSVYGIVSSYDQAAMVIGGIGGPEVAMKTDEHLPIALIGRVKAKVSAENGAIKIGDILTTSSVPGHLMRCEDPTKCSGAIAAKALEKFEKGEGTITVLVTLQ